MSDWITYEQARKRFGVDTVQVRMLARRNLVRTKKVDDDHLFFADDIQAQVQPVVPQALVAAADEWKTYSVLWAEHQVTRGWLDQRVHAGAVRTKREDGAQVYNWPEIRAAMAAPAAQAPKRDPYNEYGVPDA